MGLGRAPEEERKKFTEKLCSRGGSLGSPAGTLPRAPGGLWLPGGAAGGVRCAWKVAGGGRRGSAGLGLFIVRGIAACANSQEIKVILYCVAYYRVQVGTGAVTTTEG